MSTDNTALTIYAKAEQRFNAGRATKADEVMLSLWDEVIEQAATIRDMAIQISVLEMRHGETTPPLNEYTALMQRMTSEVKTPLV